MNRNIQLIIFSLFFCGFLQKADAQCTVNVDTANITHIVCPNGGAIGVAQIIQASYQNYSWENVTNGQTYNGGGGNGGTIRNDLDAGWYVVTASLPYVGSCPSIIYSDTFQIVEAEPLFQFSPTQACPNMCNVSVTASMQVAIAQVNYTLSFDNGNQIALPSTLQNQCGGQHTYEIIADGVSCGIENIGISQFAQMNLATTTTAATCTQSGDATVTITGVGASAVNTYCACSPQYNGYSTIDNVQFVGDNFTIINNTASVCDMYQDYTAQSADVTPGNSYNLNIDLGSCHIQNVYLDNLANVYIDWNIDGDFSDANELVAQIPSTTAPSSHALTITVPSTAIPGQSRMRIVMQNSQYQPQNTASPCDYNTAWFGATEDYTIVVNGSVANPISYLWSDGQTAQTATNLNSGTYYITITDANGCSATDTAIVMGSGSVLVVATANQTICNGGTPSALSANSGVSGSYNWSPTTNLSSSNVQNPSFTSGLSASQIYTVTFTDVNGCAATDIVSITVNPIPTATLTAIPSPACVGDDITVTANPSIPSNLFRFQYNNGAGWVNMTNPQMGNTNPVIFSNITNTTQFRIKVREYLGCNTSSWQPIITVPISTVATQPINHF